MKGIGPGPFCGMHFADLGADVIVVDRPVPADPVSANLKGILDRGKRSIILDMKNEQDVETVLKLIETADGLIEGMRPGVMERLGLGPDVCMARNPKLVYGRLTGWGQDGPLAKFAGHDLNYAGLSSAAFYSSPVGQPPVPTPTMLADIGGGAHYLMIGMLAALLQVKSTGKGDVIDVAMIDGSSHMMNLLFELTAGGMMSAEERGKGFLDGPHWYRTYECSDGKYISVGCLEPKFYAIFLNLMGLDNDPAYAKQFDATTWPDLIQRLTDVFLTKPLASWCEVLEGTDACVAPVLSPKEALEHPHMKARDNLDTSHGYIQAKGAPQFKSFTRPTPPSPPKPGEHTDAVLDELNKT
jgi:acetyl-CoA hydrolase